MTTTAVAAAMTETPREPEIPDGESRRERVHASLGMALFVGSWSMAFGTLFLSYFILRHRQGAWPPEGVALPSVGMAGLATGLLLASSLLLRGAVSRLGKGRAGAATFWNGALLLGLAFAGLQTWLWTDLLAAGRLPETGVYESVFYGLTWFHGAHVVCGLLGLAWVSLGLVRGRYHAGRTIVPGNVAVFWHFVDVVWAVLFITFFLY